MSRLPLGLRLYRAATALAEPLAPALLKARARRGKEDPARLPERLGRTSRPRPPGRLAWLHGASVGEAVSLLPLIEALHARAPHLQLLVTSGTVTSAALMARRLPEAVIHAYAPVDAPGPVRRFLDHWRPNFAVFVESEIWPNLILEAEAAGARLALLSARLSPDSLAGWRRAPTDARRLFGAFDLVMPQDEAVAAALRELGARDDGRLNLKLAGAPLPVEAEALAQAQAAAAERPVLLAASTHPGEESAVLDAFAALAGEPLLVIAPRHPERGAEVAALAQAGGWSVGRRGAGDPFGAARVYVADTLGELGLWYRVARVAFIGASLPPAGGGHNPVEAVQLGAAVVSGPRVEGWAGVFAPLADQGLVSFVADGAELGRAFARLLDSPRGPAAPIASAAQAVDEAVARLLDSAP